MKAKSTNNDGCHPVDVGQRSGFRGILLFLSGVVGAAVVLLLIYDWYPIPLPVYAERSMNPIYVQGKLLEHVELNYTNNIYFTVKTSARYYRRRLLTLMLTWFQTVHKNKLTIISDSPDEKLSYTSMIRKAGFNLNLTSCFSNHSSEGLCCKTGTEFALYYKAVEDDKYNEESYHWFCHLDDDVYVNVPELSNLLQRYDPHKPYYIGKWPGMARNNQPSVNLSSLRSKRIEKSAHMVKASTFQYATGSAYCISHALMMEAKQFFNGNGTFCDSGRLVLYRDDMAIGVIIGVILGYNLTNINEFHCQYEYLSNSTLQQMLHYITIGYRVIEKENIRTFDHVIPIGSPFTKDPTRFLAFHCLLYPQVSWCKGR